ncbi:MAG: cysteine desulfurase family protein [Candidatus Rokuibacteriota bacterium]
MRAYLDYAGFAPVDPRVTAVMRPFLEGGAGNPSAPHALGLEAREALDGSRAKIARLVGAIPAGVIFTATATEANNLALKGVAQLIPGCHVITSAIEHISVLHACRDLEKRGHAVTYLPVDSEGCVDPEAVEGALRPDTRLVSIMAANGEIGTIQLIREIGALTRRRGVPLHVDGVGAAGRTPLSVDDWGIDLLTLSSNDMYGPPGAGALWVRPTVQLVPQILGGAQEGGRRAGTENLPAIAGMGVAADLLRVEGPSEAARLADLRDRLLLGTLERISGTVLTGARARRRLPHHASLAGLQVKVDAFLLELDLCGVAASSGSACAGLTGEPSHVLRAIGCDRTTAEGSISFTLGRWTTSREIDYVLDILPVVVGRLRRRAP